MDMINARMVAMGTVTPSLPRLCGLKPFNLPLQDITDYAKLIGEMAKVLRPGGLLHLQEWDFFVGGNQKVSENRLRQPTQVTAGSEKVQLSSNARPFARWCSKFREGLQTRKASIEAGTALEAIISSQNAFGDVHQKDIWMPVGLRLSMGATPQPRVLEPG